MKRDHLQGTLESVILKRLDAGPNHGFGIALHVQEVSALHRLEKEKLIRGEWRKTENARKARFYMLTAAGRRRLVEAQAGWTAVARGLQKLLRFA